MPWKPKCWLTLQCLVNAHSAVSPWRQSGLRRWYAYGEWACHAWYARRIACLELAVDGKLKDLNDQGAPVAEQCA